MKTYKAGDKVKLIKSHYLFNDWAVNKTGVVRQKMISLGAQSYVVDINDRLLCVEGQDLELEDHDDQQKVQKKKESQ
jgi:hypothetical protein|tara:strand:+ start:124 stop:354 length:231 start_codon:yes stop_codon:yes gene_type:complete